MAAELLGATFAATTVGSGGYTSGATHLNVVSSSTGTGLSAFPATGNFRVTIFSSGGVPEVVLLVTAINSGTQFATTAEVDGNASAGDLVICTITTGGMGAILAQMNQTGAFPAPATVPFSGARWKQTDGPYEAISNGSSWQYFWNGYPVTPPPSGGWTSEGIASQIGSAAGTSNYTNGYGYLIGNDLGQQSVGVNYRAAPGSTPYSFTVRMRADLSGFISSVFYGVGVNLTVNTGAAIGFRDSGGKYLAFTLAVANSPTASLVVTYLTDNKTFSSNLVALSNVSLVGALIACPDLCLRIRNDGTNLTFALSVNGKDFAVIYSEAITAHLADAQNVFWGASKDGHSGAICLYGWTQGT